MAEARALSENILTFAPNGLKVSDLTPEDVRAALDLPRIEEKRVVFGDFGDWTLSAKHKALVNADTGKLYGIHSAGYRTVRHEEGILAVMSVVEQNPEFGSVKWSVSGADDYKRTMARGRFTEVTREVVDGDQGINPVIDYFNSYDGAWAEKLSFGAHRLVCTNGMVALSEIMRESVPHWGTERPEDFLAQINQAMGDFSAHTQIWKRWADQPLQIAHVDSVILDLGLNEKEKASVLETAEYGDMSVWDFYNVLTAHISHDMPSLNRQVKTWTKLRRISERW